MRKPPTHQKWDLGTSGFVAVAMIVTGGVCGLSCGGAPAIEEDEPAIVVDSSVEEPTTFELIARDEADGVIDQDAAWTYRLQRLFQPRELPVRYRSIRSIRCGTQLLRDFDRVASSLRPSTLEELRPFMVRPDHPLRAPFETDDESAVKLARYDLDQSRSGFVRASANEEPPRPSPNDDWVHVVCGAARSKFWAPRAYLSTAEEGCDHLRNMGWDMYGRFKQLMTREPGDDTYLCDRDADPQILQSCLDAAGGDDLIDFYLVPSLRLDDDGGWCRSVNPHDRRSPQWIEINRSLSGDDLAATIAHELFHAFQAAWDDWEDGWWAEATATWAEEYIEPIWNTEEDLELVFDLVRHEQRQLNIEDESHEYAVYLFPYYLEKIRTGSEDVIGDIWKACEVQDSLDAIDAVLDDGLDEVLKEFSIVNLDWRLYEDRYDQPLPLFGYHDANRLMLDVRDEREVRIKDVLPPLSARYHIVTNDLDPYATPLVRFRLDDYAVNRKLMLHAIIDYGEVLVEEDWSERGERVFCINRDEENFEQITLISVSAFRPAESGDGSGGSGADGLESMANTVISIEKDACRPKIGVGEFTIERDTHEEDPVISYTFTERVSGEVVFHEFDEGNAEYRGEARVRYDEHIEKQVREVKGSTVEWVKSTTIDKKGAGDVECSLHYAWGEEDTTYGLDCGNIEIRGKGYERIEYPLRGETKERSWEWTDVTDIDEGHISSYYGQLPERYDLVITGHYLDGDTVAGRTTRDYSNWTFTLDPPESH